MRCWRRSARACYRPSARPTTTSFTTISSLETSVSACGCALAFHTVPQVSACFAIGLLMTEPVCQQSQGMVGVKRQHAHAKREHAHANTGFLAVCLLMAHSCMQSSADKALDRLQEPLSDWAALRCNLRITRRVKFLQRCGLEELPAFQA